MFVSLKLAVLESIKLDSVKLQSFLCILEKTVTSKPILIFFTADFLFSVGKNKTCTCKNIYCDHSRCTGIQSLAFFEPAVM